MIGAPGQAARPVCARCGRPLVVCYCAHLHALVTRTRVLVLQHPRERHVPIGTAFMAHLSLQGSRLAVGVDFSRDPLVVGAIAGAAESPPFLLFPGDGALDVSAVPRDRPVTLLVLDGTWSQARALLRRNPALASLPRIAFAPRRPSEYCIRRQPADLCLSTIEALAEVLDRLEPDNGPFARLLDPFHAMVDQQRWYQTEVQSNRHLRRRQRVRSSSPARSTLAARIAGEWPRIVCVHGEANAWPARSDGARHPAEIVHFVAARVATGETYEEVIAPRRPLCPSTPVHLELAGDRLVGGVGVAAWHRSWQRFARTDDVLVHWGTFHVDLALDEGLPLPPGRLDLRHALRQSLGARLGTIEECAARMQAGSLPAVRGRAGRRLSALVALTQALRDRRS